MDLRAEELERHLEHVYLMAKTFAALELQERDAIADSLLSLTATFVGREHGALLLGDEGALVPVALRGGCDLAMIQGAAPLWDSLAEERVAQILSAEDIVARHAPGLPSCPRGVASVAITVHDRLMGLLVLAAGPEEMPFREVDLSFLTAVAGIGGLAISAADAVRHEGELGRALEKAAAAERRAAAEKGLVIVELDKKIGIIERQHEEILALSAPIVEVGDGVLAVPLIGALDARRSGEIMARVLEDVVARRARFILFDMTGVEDVSADMAEHFSRLVSAVSLMGAEGIITGIRPRVARVLIELGVDLSRIRTLRSLRQGIDAARAAPKA